MLRLNTPKYFCQLRPGCSRYLCASKHPFGLLELDHKLPPSRSRKATPEPTFRNSKMLDLDYKLPVSRSMNVNQEFTSQKPSRVRLNESAAIEQRMPRNYGKPLPTSTDYSRPKEPNASSADMRSDRHMDPSKAYPKFEPQYEPYGTMFESNRKIPPSRSTEEILSLQEVQELTLKKPSLIRFDKNVPMKPRNPKGYGTQRPPAKTMGFDSNLPPTRTTQEFTAQKSTHHTSSSNVSQESDSADQHNHTQPNADLKNSKSETMTVIRHDIKFCDKDNRYFLNIEERLKDNERYLVLHWREYNRPHVFIKIGLKSMPKFQALLDQATVIIETNDEILSKYPEMKPAEVAKKHDLKSFKRSCSDDLFKDNRVEVEVLPPNDERESSLLLIKKLIGSSTSTIHVGSHLVPRLRERLSHTLKRMDDAEKFNQKLFNHETSVDNMESELSGWYQLMVESFLLAERRWFIMVNAAKDNTLVNFMLHEFNKNTNKRKSMFIQPAAAVKLLEVLKEFQKIILDCEWDLPPGVKHESDQVICEKRFTEPAFHRNKVMVFDLILKFTRSFDINPHLGDIVVMVGMTDSNTGISNFLSIHKNILPRFIQCLEKALKELNELKKSETWLQECEARNWLKPGQESNKEIDEACNHYEASSDWPEEDDKF